MSCFPNQDQSSGFICPLLHKVPLDILRTQDIWNKRQHATYSGGPYQFHLGEPHLKLCANLGSQGNILHERIDSIIFQPSSTMPGCNLLSCQNTWTAYSLPWR